MKMLAFESNGNRAFLPENEPAAPAAPFDPSSLNPIYEEAAVETHPSGYTILKVAGMAASPHLAGMPPEARRNALLMALQAAGVELSVVVADAVARQRALNGHEDKLVAQLSEFEAAKAKEIAALQAELDRLASECKLRIQANKDEVARQQAAFQEWRKLRRQESQRIAAAASLLVPADSPNGGETLAALLDRATSKRP
jgi:hypothetical protein